MSTISNNTWHGQPATHEAILAPSSLSGLATKAFVAGPVLLRKLQHYRPYICPFGELIPLVPRGSRVLDVGCGGGLWLVLLRDSGRLSSGIGFDSSKQAIELAKQVDPKSGVSLEFRHLPAQADWPAGEFDAVSIIDVLHHVPPPVAPALFRNAFARLRPGGLLIYKDIYPGSWRSVCNRLHDLVIAREMIHLVRPEVVKSHAAAAGFGLRSQRRINTLWYGHELMVFEKPEHAASPDPKVD